ncbi:hypothetical protein CMV_029176 [Castanea mollissima]|uniref:Uncharacterized protein n=1 Tax=Castanea mollissima TaxID=60419 RepID=A0A8J4QBY2_9ROSI|nr:hypothetical protein CMV_029176 [Castanea mollissima]
MHSTDSEESFGILFLKQRFKDARLWVLHWRALFPAFQLIQLKGINSGNSGGFGFLDPIISPKFPESVIVVFFGGGFFSMNVCKPFSPPGNPPLLLILVLQCFCLAPSVDLLPHCRVLCLP